MSHHTITEAEAKVFIEFLYSNKTADYLTLRNTAVDVALVDWPEGEGFGSSDGYWAMLGFVCHGPEVGHRWPLRIPLNF